MSVFAIFFWLWFAVSTTLFIQRRIRTRTAKRVQGHAPTTLADTPGLGAPAPPPAPSPSPTVAPTPVPRAPIDEPDRAAHRVSTRAAGHRTGGIAEALQGIALPCDLAPLTLGMTELDPDHVDLVTTGVGPDQVASELTAELERLGYAVSELGAGEQLADRDGTVVRMKVHDRPRLSVGSDGRGFATAPPDGIVVELTVV